MRSGRLSVTARWVATQRARLAPTRPSTPGGDVEGERRLYADVGGAFAVPLRRATGVAARTRVVDAEVGAALGRGTHQVVLLGAGYDGRALRFGGAQARWFEVDLAATQSDKRSRLRRLGLEAAGVCYVTTDFGRDDLGAALDASGHDRSAPSLFVCEELFTSLTLEAAARVCQALRARAAAGSTLVAAFVVAPDGGATGRARRSVADLWWRAVGALRRSEFAPGDPEKLMAVTGWRVVHAESSDRSPRGLVLVGEPGPSSRPARRGR